MNPFKVRMPRHPSCRGSPLPRSLCQIATMTSPSALLTILTLSTLGRKLFSKFYHTVRCCPSTPLFLFPFFFDSRCPPPHNRVTPLTAIHLCPHPSPMSLHFAPILHLFIPSLSNGPTIAYSPSHACSAPFPPLFQTKALFISVARAPLPSTVNCSSMGHCDFRKALAASGVWFACPVPPPPSLTHSTI